MLNGHGDDLYAYPNIRFNFSSNVYYNGCPEDLIQVLQNGIKKRVANYPSPVAEELSKMAADFHNHKEENVLFFNGATEAFYTIAHCFQGKSALVFGPTFSEYEDACRTHGLVIDWTERTRFEHCSSSADLAFLCNPNNPDGAIADRTTIEDFMRRNPETYLVVDEAYIGFTKSVNSVIDLCNDFDRLIVVRSLTKVFGIPGLRLGYVIGATEFIDRLKQKKMPWSVNGLAILAGEYIFENYKELHFSVEALLEEMIDFKEALSSIDYLELLPTSTTYVLAELKKGKASELKHFLVTEHDILVRDATNFTGIQGEFIRLSLQSKDANDALVQALRKW